MNRGWNAPGFAYGRIDHHERGGCVIELLDDPLQLRAGERVMIESCSGDTSQGSVSRPGWVRAVLGVGLPGREIRVRRQR